MIQKMDTQSPPLAEIRYLEMADGSRRAYHQLLPSADDSRPGILFCAGHGSDMFGTKAQILCDFANAQGLGFLRFDYFGHGLSDGALVEGTISRWVDDALQMMDRLTQGPQIIIGSSLGGWVMLRLAQERADRIAGLIGIAAAPDFTERLIWGPLSDEQKQQVREQGFLAEENPYSDEDVIYSYELICDGRDNLVLSSELKIDAPVILHHGMRDAEVPWRTSVDIASQISSPQVTVQLDKDADHRYSGPEQLRALTETARRLISAPSE